MRKERDPVIAGAFAVAGSPISWPPLTSRTAPVMNDELARRCWWRRIRGAATALTVTPIVSCGASPLGL